VGRLDTQLQGSLQRLLVGIDQRDPAGLRDASIEIMDRSDAVDGESLERSLGPRSAGSPTGWTVTLRRSPGSGTRRT